MTVFASVATADPAAMTPLRPGVAGLDQALHRRDHVRRGERGAVLPGHALAQLERPHLEGRVGRPRQGQTRRDVGGVGGQGAQELERLRGDPVARQVDHRDRVQALRTLAGDPDRAAGLARGRGAARARRRRRRARAAPALPAAAGARARRGAAACRDDHADRAHRESEDRGALDELAAAQSPGGDTPRRRRAAVGPPIGAPCPTRNSPSTRSPPASASLGDDAGQRSCARSRRARPHVPPAGPRCSERYWRPYPLSTNRRVAAGRYSRRAHHRHPPDRLILPLDPSFPAAWDPVPRRSFAATIVRVETDEGVVGIGSGDTMDGFEAFEHLFVGEDPLAIARHVRVLETIDFHAGRYWPLEAALWDILGQVAGLPVATLFGGATDGLPVYASCGMLLPPAARAESALRLRDEGFRRAQDPGRSAPARGGSRRGRRDARRGRRVDGDHGRHQPGLADGRRHVALARPGRRPRDRRAARGRSTSCGWRSPWRARTCAGLAALRARRRGSASPAAR